MNIPVVLRLWKCPSCGTVDRTERADAHTRMHNCLALGGITVPFVEVKDIDLQPKARQVLVEREDYIGTSNAGRVMAVRTERADGSNDCTVYAPTAELDAL